MYQWENGEYHIEPEWFHDERVSKEMRLLNSCCENNKELSRKKIRLMWFKQFRTLGILLEIPNLPF